MNPPEKSSDEILQELFGLCQQQLKANSDASSNEDESSESSDSEEDSRSRKHKHKRKKKKKHKKGKKRKKTTDDEDSDSKSYKRKLKKIKKESDVHDESVPVSKVELKIKAEKEDSAETHSRQRTTGESSQNKENKSNNYVNAVTGKLLTLDDVFHTLGIITEGPMISKIKQEKMQTEEIASHIKREKEFVLLRPEQIKKEKLDEDGAASRVKKEKESMGREVADGKPESKQELWQTEDSENSNMPGGSGKTSISEVFTDEADKQISGSKKISIKNLKNSLVYEATMKEIEEREKYRAEKYEEGELSTETESSEDDSSDLKKDENSSKSLDELKKRHKSHDKKRKHKLHSSKKKHRHEGNRTEHKGDRKRKKLDHDHQSRNDSLRSHSHQRSEHGRSRSVESESSVPSKRSRKSTNRSRRQKSSRERSRSRSRNRMKPNRFKSEYECVEKIDKQKLLEIARKNAINLLQQGAIPASVMACKTKIASIKAGGKTVDELTDFCKQLSRKEAEGEDSDPFSSGSENNDTKIAFHHPFQLKERPSSIIMNIRNAIPLPTKTAQEKTLELSKQLSLQYPVSSGQQHQISEWVPVEKSDSTVSTQISNSYSNALVDPNSMVAYPLPQTVPHRLPSPYQPPSLPKANSILPAPKKIDIGNIVAQRLEAIRRLNENPQDPIGTNLIQTANSKMSVWAESKVQPGFFTGSTGVRPLSVAELSAGYKAWPKKVDILTFSQMLRRLIKTPRNQFIAAKPVNSDKGEALMKKMGWQPGEGLGKYKQGPAAPCEISMKTDRKGLAEQPVPKGFKQSCTLQMAIENTQNKHPVSLLNEFCSRRKLPTPQYDCEEKEGTAKRKLFLFSVTVQGLRYTPKMPSTNKKQSKMEAATVCLQSLGLLPTVAPTVAE